MGIYPYIKDSDNKDLVSKLYDFEKNKQNFRKSTVPINSLERSNNFLKQLRLF